MRKLCFVLVVLMAFGFSACSSSKGSSGAKSTDEISGGDFRDGNIPTGGDASALKDINFGFDSSELTTSSIDTLKGHAGWIGKNARGVTIEGHCDERGTAEYNLALGDRRARAAYDYLRSLGVKSEQMKTVSYGKEVPLDPASNESAWAKNRRDHFRVE